MKDQHAGFEHWEDMLVRLCSVRSGWDDVALPHQVETV